MHISAGLYVTRLPQNVDWQTFDPGSKQMFTCKAKLGLLLLLQKWAFTYYIYGFSVTAHMFIVLGDHLESVHKATDH